MNNTEQKKPATLDDVVVAIQQNQQVLEEIRVWTKINGVEKVQSVLNNALDTPEKRMVYHLSDGKTTREIYAICSVSIGTVSTYWNSWNRLGIMKTISVKRGDRFIKSFDLEDYSVEVPTITKKEPDEKSTTPQQKSTDEQPKIEVESDAN